MAAQLVFDLSAPPAFGREDFFVTPANALAVKLIERVGDWPEGKLLLTGPLGSGKSHLARIWAGDHGAEVFSPDTLPDLARGPAVVENIDRSAGNRRAETALFHFHNAMRAGRWPLLMTGTGSPRDWRFELPDLASRVQAATVAVLEAPDDELLAAVLVKLFNDRQIAVQPPLIQYLVPRIERSFAAAHDVVATLDARSLALGRPVTRALAAEVLDLSGDDSP